MQHSPQLSDKAHPQMVNIQGERPNLSSAKAYAICGKIKRMMKIEGVQNYESKHLRLMNTPYSYFLKQVNHVLIFELNYTSKEAKNWIHEQL